MLKLILRLKSVKATFSNQKQFFGGYADLKRGRTEADAHYTQKPFRKPKKFKKILEM